MSNSIENSKILINSMAKEFIEKISQIPLINTGIYQALQLICKKSNLWELEIFLIVAETEPIKVDIIFERLKDKVSKSTIYRKISAFVDQKLLLKEDNGYLSLGANLSSLKIIAQLNKTNRDVKYD